VNVSAGLTTTVRNGDNSAPTNPTQAPPSVATEAITATNFTGGLKPIEAHHVGKGTAIAIAVIVAIPAIVLPILATRSSSSTVTVPPVVPPKCNPATSQCG